MLLQFGKPAPATFGSALQGIAWTNHDFGQDVALQVHARLASSPRAVSDPAEADLFFIPFYSWQLAFVHVLYEEKEAPEALAAWPWQRHCETWFTSFPNATQDLWTWLSTQPSFQQSDCSNHFIVLANVNGDHARQHIIVRIPDLSLP
jgi:hypothetical protein